MKEQDLRVTKLKSVIDAFYQLLEKRRFESIPVNELFDNVMVHRTTL